MFRLPAPLCCKLFYNLTASLTSSKQSFEGYLRCCLLGLKSQEFSLKTLYFQAVTSFFSWHLADDKGTRADSSSSPGCYRDPEPWFLCPSACSASPDESGWVSPGSRISHYWLMILSFIQWGKKLSSKLGFKVYLAAQFRHRVGYPQSED